MDNQLIEDELFTFIGIGQALSRTFQLFKREYAVFCSLSGAMVLPCAIVGLSVLFAMGDFFYQLKTSENQGSIHNYITNHLGTISKIVAVQLLVAFVTFIAGEGAMIRAAADIYVGTQPIQGWMEYMKAGLRKFCNVFLAGLFVFGCVFGAVVVFELCIATVSTLLWLLLEDSGTFLLVLLAIVSYIGLIYAIFYIITSSMLVFPVIVIEGKGPIDALQRSYELSHGRLCYIFCVVFLLALCKAIVSNALSVLFTNFGRDPTKIFSPVGFTVVFLLPTFFFLPLSAIIKTVVYVSIRADKEGLNQSALRGELAEATMEHAEAPVEAADRTIQLSDGMGSGTATYGKLATEEGIV